MYTCILKYETCVVITHFTKLRTCMIVFKYLLIYFNNQTLKGLNLQSKFTFESF